MLVPRQKGSSTFLKRLGLILLAVLCGGSVFPLPAGAAAPGPNLLPNLEFSETAAGWQRQPLKVPGVAPSRVFFCTVTGHPGKLLALAGGPDRNGRVWCQIGNIRPHTDYLLEFDAYRPRFTNGVYLEVELFGQRRLINQHFSYSQVQPISLRLNSGNTRGATHLTIINSHDEVLAFGSPSLRLAAARAEDTWQAESVRLPGYFPVGIFAATPDDLAEIRAGGFNAVQSYETRPEMIRSMAATAKKLGLQFLPNFRAYRADLSRDLGGRPELLGFYIEDEPEGRSVPPGRLEDLKKALKRDHPRVLTAVAMLRPQMVAAYRDSADVFMLDPYPVPHMPMTWLADALEEAARSVTRERLWAVIQAFGGKSHGEDGWPRRPTPQEMRCLTYLALVHGAHGIFYFSYPEVRSDAASWEGLQKIVRELRQLNTWLVLSNEAEDLRVEIFSPFKADAAGHPALHFCRKRRGEEQLLVLVNVIEKPVSFYLHGLPPEVSWLTEYFQGIKAVVQDGNIRETMGPYEVRLYSYRQ